MVLKLGRLSRAVEALEPIFQENVGLGLGSGVIPKSLKLDNRIFLYKISTSTTIAVRSLQTQYEGILLNLFIKHHKETIQEATASFSQTFLEAQQSPNLMLLVLGWHHIATKTRTMLVSRREAIKNNNNTPANTEAHRKSSKKPQQTTTQQLLHKRHLRIYPGPPWQSKWVKMFLTFLIILLQKQKSPYLVKVSIFAPPM